MSLSQPSTLSSALFIALLIVETRWRGRPGPSSSTPSADRDDEQQHDHRAAAAAECRAARATPPAGPPTAANTPPRITGMTIVSQLRGEPDARPDQQPEADQQPRHRRRCRAATRAPRTDPTAGSDRGGRCPARSRSLRPPVRVADDGDRGARGDLATDSCARRILRVVRRPAAAPRRAYSRVRTRPSAQTAAPGAPRRHPFAPGYDTRSRPAISSISAMSVSLTRGRPCGSPSACSCASMRFQPV